jgi:hypothetical protein
MGRREIITGTLFVTLGIGGALIVAPNLVPLGVAIMIASGGGLAWLFLTAKKTPPPLPPSQITGGAGGRGGDGFIAGAGGKGGDVTPLPGGGYFIQGGAGGQGGAPHPEAARRAQIMEKLRHKYTLDHDNISSAILAGLEDPPREWTNEQLANLGEDWRV